MPIFPLVVVYALIRLLSFGTYQYPFGNEIFAALGILSFSYLCFKNTKLGWLLLVAELILDGAGHFFELQSLLLRTWFLGIFGLVWVVKKIRTKDVRLPSKSVFYSLLGLGAMVIFSVINGFIHGHAPMNIVQDMILFFFLILLFPAADWKIDTEKIVNPLIKAWIWGTSLFSLLTLGIYSSGLGHLPDTYYHWFRNIAAGKITDLGNHFFRIVLPEQVFIVPIILVLAALLLTDLKNKKLWLYLSSSLFILALNFSRIYFLALAIGFLVLIYQHAWKKWLVVSTASACLLILIFTGTHLLASRGVSSGLELLGVRVSGTTAPTSDVSGAIRLAILPDALRQIKERPWFGSGLGATIRYTDPATKELVTRTQFDWGYLELLAELGIVGTLVYFIFFGTVIKQTVLAGYGNNLPNPVVRGLLAGASALAVITITTPALLHGFGMLYLVMLLTITSHTIKNTP